MQQAKSSRALELAAAYSHRKEYYKNNIFTVNSHRVTSISENEMNIRISLCNVRYVNGMLNISLEIFPKKTH